MKKMEEKAYNGRLGGHPWRLQTCQVLKTWQV